jgi:UDP-N-acetylmuramoyl-tripeptide--D-alanyl-D-alanine ligase
MSVMTTLSQVHAMLPGSKLLNISEQEAHSVTIFQVGTDSRKIESKELFVALSGDRFDAHDFLKDVARSKAAGALISEQDKCPADLAAVCVPDTRIGLGEFAKAWRKNHPIPLVVVTGSNGKTTVKEMIASIFRSAVGDQHTLVTKGNLNNEIGLPLTLLKLRSSDQLAVVELGMNHPGETAQLADIAQANIALINNAQREHQEFMATVEAVAHEHADVIKALPQDGTAVFPADSEFSKLWYEAANGRKVIDFDLESDGKKCQAAVVGKTLNDGRIQVRAGSESVEIQLNTLGTHNIRNALAASAVGLAAGIDLQKIKEGLEAFSPVAGRMQTKKVESFYTLIDDTYNANPDSVRAAIDALKQSGNTAWLVLGDMGEVGDQGPEFHREVGAYAAEQGVTKLFALGEQSRFTVEGFGDAQHFSDVESLIAQLKNLLLAQSALQSQHINILVKGSRFMRMERVVQALMEEAKACS